MTSTEVETSTNSAKTIYNQNAGIIFEKLLTFYEGNEFFDTILITGEENNRVSIQAHRLVLSSLSEYFLETFRDAQTVLKKNVLIFQEIQSQTLKSVIDFMYTGSIELTLETVERILRAVVMLKMKMLIDVCCEFIEENINHSNGLTWFRVATELNLHALKASSKKFIYKHFEQISKVEEMLMLSSDELRDLLFNDNPYGDLEEYIFRSVVDWINYDKTTREDLAVELLSMVRSQYLSPKFIIENRKSVCKNAECQELIYNWLEWHLSPETSPIEQQKPDLTQPIVSDVDEERFLAVVDISESDPKEIVIQLYDPITETWPVQKKIPLLKTKSLISTIVINDRLIIVGGNDSYNLPTNSVECLNLHTFEWTDLCPIKYPRSLSQLAFLKGCIYVLGGVDRPYVIDCIEAYNISTRKVYEVKLVIQPNSKSKIAAQNGILYIMDMFGGCLQFYDVSSNDWASKTIEKDVLQNFGFVAVEGFLYIIGGERGSCLQKTMKRYNLSSNTWTELASLPYPCSHIKTTIFENKIVICGKTILSDDVIAQYNIQSDKWKILGPLPFDRSIQSSTICTLTTRIK